MKLLNARRLVGSLLSAAVLVAACAAVAVAAPKVKEKEDEEKKAPPAPAAKTEKKEAKSADDAKPAAPGGAVYRYMGNKKGTLSGAQAMMLMLEDVFTGKKDTLYVPNNDADAKQYDPLTDVVSSLEGIEVGTPVQVETEKVKGRAVVKSIEKADYKPGEELPNGFVFVEQDEQEAGGMKNVIVTLSKFGREIKVGVPMKKDDEYKDAQWEPDKKIDSVVRRLQSGTVVEATFRKQGKMPMIVEIYPYEKPERGKFVKVKEVEYNGWPAAGFEILDEKGTAITFTVDGVEQSKNGKTLFAPNPQQLRAVQKLKPDTEVEVRYRVDGRTWMMRDIKVLSTAAKPAKGAKSSKPADGEDKMKEDKEPPKDEPEKPAKAGKQ